MCDKILIQQTHTFHNVGGVRTTVETTLSVRSFVQQWAKYKPEHRIKHLYTGVFTALSIFVKSYKHTSICQ